MFTTHRWVAGAMMVAAMTVCAAPATALAAPARVDHVIVSSFSEKGDFIDNGVSMVYAAHWATITATTTGIDLSYRNPTSHRAATFAFVPVAGQSFAVGQYNNVQLATAPVAGFAGINITGPGEPSGCSRLTGSFDILDLAAAASGRITRLDLTYVEHCGAGRPANFGEVLINDAPHVGSLVASATQIVFPDQTPTLPYVLTNPTSRAQPVSLWQSATAVSHFTFTPGAASCAASVAAHSSCTYFVRLLPPRPGFYDATVLVASGSSTLRVDLSGPAGGV